MFKRTIIVGDLHGAYDDARNLLDKCNHSSSDRVIFLGDLVDRGPDNDKCVDLAIQLEKAQGVKACVLGNHEHKHIQYYEQERNTGRKPHIHVQTHIDTRKQLTQVHYDYFKSLPDYIDLPEFDTICVHAGIYPGENDISKQEKRHLLHIQSICPVLPDGTEDPQKITKWPSKVTSDPAWQFWTNFYEGTKTIVFGHSVLTKPLVTKNVVGLDGGAVFGKELWAYILPDKQIVRVQSKIKAYDNRAKTFRVHGDVFTY